MSLLEQPRRPRPIAAVRQLRLDHTLTHLARFSSRHWPLTWLACHMLCFAAGGHWAGQTSSLTTHLPLSTTTVLVRGAALLPALLPLGGAVVTGAVWLGVGTCAAIAGAVESNHRTGRIAAKAAARWLPAHAVLQNGVAVVRTTGWARPGKNERWSAPARLLAWAESDTLATPSLPPQPGMGLLLAGQQDPPLPGQVLAGAVELGVPPAAALPGAFDYRRYLSGRGLQWQARLLRPRPVVGNDPVALVSRNILGPVRAAVIGRLAVFLPPREANLATAVLLGARSPESREISAPFTSLGLAHLFAVSGLHVGILLGIVLLPGRWLGASPRLTVLILWLFVPLYLLLTGLPGSVVRAGGMGLLAAQARPLGRQADALRLLGLLYWAGSILDPLQDLDTGLQLSYLAAGGILLLSRVTGGLRFTTRPWLQPVLAGLAVSFAAQWFTLPIVAASFGQISLVSPLANLIAVPLFGLAVWAVVLGLVAGVIWSSAGLWLGALGWLLLRLISGGVAWLSHTSGGLPWGLAVPAGGQIFIWLLLTGVLLGCLRLRPHIKRRWQPDLLAWGILPLLALMVFGPWARQLPDKENVTVWQFAVGQGDCGLVAFPDGWTALIDTGGRFGHRAPPMAGPVGRSILPFLRRQGIQTLDAVLLTHGHLDHTGGALALVDQMEVEQWLVSGRAAKALNGQVDSLRIRHPEAGTVLHSWREWSLSVVYPLAGQTTAPSENNWSLVSVLRHRNQTVMVWSGDLELAGEAALLGSYPHLARTQIWKAGHHGSDTSGSAGLLDLMRPQMVLISCGVDNSYGHPSHGPYVVGADTLAVLRTDLDGSICLQWPSSGPLRWHTSAARGEIRRLP